MAGSSVHACAHTYLHTKRRWQRFAIAQLLHVLDVINIRAAILLTVTANRMYGVEWAVTIDQPYIINSNVPIHFELF